MDVNYNSTDLIIRDYKNNENKNNSPANATVIISTAGKDSAIDKHKMIFNDDSRATFWYLLQFYVFPKRQFLINTAW